MAILTTRLFDSGSGHHWTTVITAAILTGSTRIQAIRDKHTRLGTGIPIEWFVLPNSQVLASEAVFSNLKILEITIDAVIITPQSYESLNKALYSWLGAIGTKVEHLELRFRDTGYRRNPWADKYWIERIKLPAKKIFPKLKHLSLENLDLSLDTLTGFLMNAADTLEWLGLHICDLENEKEDWLSFLEFSKGKLKTLRHLAMYISRPNEQAEEFLLPDIVVVDGWNSPRTRCYVKTPKNPFESSNGDVNILADRRGFETLKILDEELEINKDADSFWESMTDGFWKNDRVVNWGGFRSMQLSL
ncbi:hypothetical protein H072_1581 [Dactylellina haptotyla CBS 200.50]|uniref:F-box domain-containing protein n=1 Tax=Dactylellina haptotyla (strain CBS 200.50) TaxID=1284197 RepID=S8C9R9_DACHA|nr:hypothetical protein H072_1581 [Dactylellina haptotyla CBS 200.50]